jgi:hypothetical protein
MHQQTAGLTGGFLEPGLAFVAGPQYPRSHTAATDLKPAASARRVFLLLLSGAVSCCCLSRRCCSRSARAASNLAAHRCSHLLSRSRGILLITGTPGFEVAPGSKVSTRAGLKRSYGESAAGAHAPAPIARHLTARESRTHQRLSQARRSATLVSSIMAGLFTGKRTGRSASWEHVRIGSSIL